LQHSEFREKGVNSSEWGAGKSLRQAAAFTGARRGELRGVFWENYRDGELLIARSIWNGITTDPKSRKSKAPIPIIPKLAAKLEAHRDTPQETENRADLFQTGPAMRSIPTACCAGSFCRRLRSASSVASQNRSTAEQPINTNGTRYCPRGAATNLIRLGVDDSVIQRILRHSNVAVT
jgi:integrase